MKYRDWYNWDSTKKESQVVVLYLIHHLLNYNFVKLTFALKATKEFEYSKDVAQIKSHVTHINLAKTKNGKKKNEGGE